ncbi:MAG TPA: ATP-binding protein [Geobacteraceae bacterium]
MNEALSGKSHERLQSPPTREQRFTRSLPLWICGDNMDSFRTELINISPSGLYCKVPNYVHPYSKLMVTFDLPFLSGDSATVECEGIVVRVEPGVQIPGIQEHRLAIDFCNLDHETTCLLHDFLAEPAAARLDRWGLPDVPGIDRLSTHRGCAIPDVSGRMIMDQHTARMDRLAVLGELTEGLAHKIKNPLGCIASTVQVIADEAGGDGEKRDIYRAVLAQIDLLDGTLRHLLQCASPNTPSFAPLKLESIIDRTLLLLADRILEKKARLHVRHGFDQPPIQGDEVMLQQAFSHIILNALEAMDQGATLSVQTCWGFGSPSCAKKECGKVSDPGGSDSIIVAIKDTGCGIDPAALVRIFNPFYTTKHTGKGLGLPIAHRIIEQHYGSIYVESKPGTGSTFLVCLPMPRGEGRAQ